MRLAGLGVEILLAAFQWHPSRRQKILTLAQQKLLGTTADAAMPFVRVLACLVRNEYGLLSAHLDQLRVRHGKSVESQSPSHLHAQQARPHVDHQLMVLPCFLLKTVLLIKHVRQ